MPYPGTPLFDLAVKEGFAVPSSLKDWARMGTFDHRSVEEKGLAEVSEKVYEDMAKNARRRAVINSYMKEIKRDPITAPVRGLKFLFKKKEERGQ
jgi:hypothetical protein